jgi:YD repeat-containing protein
VRQFQGVHVAPDWNVADRYAEATYSYAVTDQLAGVDQLVDSVNKVHTSIFYDWLGYKSQMVDPDMGTWTYTYDAMGNVKRQTDARGKTVCFYYDGHNRLKGKQYRTDQNCPPATPTPAFDVSYGYDTGANAKGHRTDTTVNASGALDNQLAWTYDVRGRVDSETRTITGLAGTYTTRYTYDSADRLRTMTYPDPDNEVVTTGYHSTMGLPQSLQSSLNPSASLVAVDAATGYDASNRLTAISFPAGSPGGSTLWRRQEFYPWNQRYGAGRLKSIRVETVLSLGDRLNLHDYQYDDAGNVTAAWDGSTQYTFQYDDLNQLTWAYDRSYAYDQAGRFTQFAGLNYTPDPNHPHAVRQVNGSVLYDYDQDGNMITRYDWEGQSRSSGTARTD